MEPMIQKLRQREPGKLVLACKFCIGLILALAFFIPQAARAYEVHYADTGYKVTSGMDYAIHYELKKLIARHETAFRRKAPPEYTITYYVFPTYKQYSDFSAKKGKKVSPELLGYTESNTRFDTGTGEILAANVSVVTWRQAQPAVLLTTVLHESAHAVMHAFLLQVPLWMNEGSADWFGQPAWTANGAYQKLDRARRWQTLQLMLEKNDLPPLRAYLESDNYEEWGKMFRGNIGMGYVVGYSLFDYFMVSPNSQAFLTKLLRSEDVEKSEKPEAAFTAAIDKNWPGGLVAFERNWHEWIKRKAEYEKRTVGNLQR